MIKDMIKDMKFPSWQGEVQNGKFVPKKGTRIISAQIIANSLQVLEDSNVQSL